MAVAEIDVKYVAHLARLVLKPEEETIFAGQLGQVSLHREVEGIGCEQGRTRPRQAAGQRDAADEIRPSISAEDALRQPRPPSNGLFVVPEDCGVTNPNPSSYDTEIAFSFTRV